MRRCALVVSLVLGAASLLAGWAPPTQSPSPASGTARPAPDVGDLAPDFSLPGTDGRLHTLAEHRGLRPVVIAWFPKAFAKT